MPLYLPPVSFVTVLPSTTGLADGYEVAYIADATNDVVWRLKYRAASGSANKWMFLGGPPLISEVLTQEAIASGTTYTTLTTAGPTVTVPLAGDYDVTVSGYLISAASQRIHMSYQVGATAASDNDAVVNAQAGESSCFRDRRQTGVAASTAFAARYKQSAVASHGFANRKLSVLPVRVG